MSLETLLAAGFSAAALLLVAHSMRKAASADRSLPRTGEAVWSLVAVTVMLGTAMAVCASGGHRGF